MKSSSFVLDNYPAIQYRIDSNEERLKDRQDIAKTVYTNSNRSNNSSYSLPSTSVHSPRYFDVDRHLINNETSYIEKPMFSMNSPTTAMNSYDCGTRCFHRMSENRRHRATAINADQISPSSCEVFSHPLISTKITYLCTF